MRIRFALLSASLALLAACGDPGPDNHDAGPTYYAFSTGTYAVSNAVLTSTTDQCGLLGAYTDPAKKIGLTVSGNSVTVNLSNDPAAAADTLPKAVLVGNAIEQPTEANYTAAFGSSCVVRIKRTVVGTLTANNTATLTLSFSAATEPPTTCVASNTSFAALPCASTYQFVATKQ